MGERFIRSDDIYYDWPEVRLRAFISERGIEVDREGVGWYTLRMDFTVHGAVAMSLTDVVGPSRDRELLAKIIAEANADDPSCPFELPDPDDLSDPRLYLRAVVPWTDGGVTVAELDACRVRLIARMDAYYGRIRAIGRLPTIIHVDDDGVGRMYVDAGRVREQEEQKARLAAEAGDPTPEKPKDTKGE